MSPTVSVMLLGVLSFKDFAGGVVPFTNTTSIGRSRRPQNTVAAHSLGKKQHQIRHSRKNKKNNFLSSVPNVPKNYLAQSIYTDVRAVLGTQGPVLNLAGQSEEEVIAFSEAVQFAYVLIWKATTQPWM